MALAQRLYDVQGGQVLLDSTDVRRLQVKWLRSHIGVVSQEPVRACGPLSCSTVCQGTSMGLYVIRRSILQGCR